MSTGPAVAKTVWTDADFDTMSWHDAAVHAIARDLAEASGGAATRRRPGRPPAG